MAMDAQEKYEYWLDTAQYDLDTAEAMLNGGRWLYVVFMCQQAIEKLVKGLYILYADDNVPKTHNIRVIIEKFEALLPEAPTDERLNLFDDLTVHYLNGRYADYKEKLSERLNEGTAKGFLGRRKETFAWLLTLAP
ncbi:MAG: HEPN domain-containing protein [Clostridiales Family XIII bacterium]|jgi:HEPN domain-containing protein|nr:HEPN domain-containing protein [Clostridiales Family XIII bacterium]